MAQKKNLYNVPKDEILYYVPKKIVEYGPKEEFLYYGIKEEMAPIRDSVIRPDRRVSL